MPTFLSDITITDAVVNLLDKANDTDGRRFILAEELDFYRRKASLEAIQIEVYLNDDEAQQKFFNDRFGDLIQEEDVLGNRVYAVMPKTSMTSITERLTKNETFNNRLYNAAAKEVVLETNSTKQLVLTNIALELNTLGYLNEM